MAHSKRIIISGYYGFSNTGDEAVLAAVVGGLRASGVDDITVLSASPGKTSETYAVEAISRNSALGVISALRDCDLFISGGGSLLQDATSVRSLWYYSSLIGTANRFARKTMVLGQGIGPLRRNASRKLAARVLRNVDLITVRDVGSAELLKDLGITDKVRVTADPTFLLDPCPPEESLNLLSQAGLDGDDDVIGVSLRRWPEAPGIEQAAVEALREIASRLPVKLLLVAMQSPADEILARDVRAKTGALVQPGIWTPQQMLGVLSRCRLVLGMRLHALILSAAVGTPSVGIEYDPKVEQFLAAAGQEGISLAEAESGLLAERVLKAWEARDILASRLETVVPPMKAAAAENIRLALELLDS